MRPKEYMPADILASVLLSVVSLLAVLLIPVSIWQMIALGILLIILGYVLTMVLFPGADDLVPIWRAALSLGTSVSCAAMLIISQSLVPREAGLDAIASVISAFAIFLSGLAYLRRIDLPRSRRFSPISKRGIRRSGFSAPSMRSFKIPVLILVVLLAASAFAFTFISSQKETSAKDGSQLRVQGVGHDEKIHVSSASKDDDDSHPAAIAATLIAVDTASPSMSPQADVETDKSVECVKSTAEKGDPQEASSNVAESISQTKAVFLINGTSGSDKNRAENQKSSEDAGIANNVGTQGTSGTSASSSVASRLSINVIPSEISGQGHSNVKQSSSVASKTGSSVTEIPKRPSKEKTQPSSTNNAQPSVPESSRTTAAEINPSSASGRSQSSAESISPSSGSLNVASRRAGASEQEIDLTDQINEGSGSKSSGSASPALAVAKGSIEAVGSKGDVPQMQNAAFDVVITDKTQKDDGSSTKASVTAAAPGTSATSSTNAASRTSTAPSTSAEDSGISEDDLSSDALESSGSAGQTGSSVSSSGAQSSSGRSNGISAGSREDYVSHISSDIKSEVKSSHSEIANEIDGWVSTRGLKAKGNGKDSFESKNIAFEKNGGRAVLGSKVNPVRLG